MLRQVLLEIKNARGNVSLNDLSRKMGIERSVLGGMLDHLVHKGRRRDEIQEIGRKSPNVDHLRLSISNLGVLVMLTVFG